MEARVIGLVGRMEARVVGLGKRGVAGLVVRMKVGVIGLTGRMETRGYRSWGSERSLVLGFFYYFFIGTVGRIKARVIGLGKRGVIGLVGRMETRVIGLGKRGVVGLAVRIKARGYRSLVQCGSEGLSVFGAVWKRGVIGFSGSLEDDDKREVCLANRVSRFGLAVRR